MAKLGGVMSAYSQRKEEITGLTEFLGHRRPAGRLMRRIVREHPEASLEEVVHLFREAALEDPAAFEDVLMQALTRDQSEHEDDPRGRLRRTVALLARDQTALLASAGRSAGRRACRAERAGTGQQRKREESTMMCRIWRGWTTKRSASAYEQVVRGQVIPGIEAKRIAGFRHIDLMRRELDDEVEFTTLMWFDSLESVKDFMGEDYAVSHVPAQARAVLTRFDERAAHFEVLDRRPQSS
jgi:heme-degrading monooxygenase HmoA